MAIFLLAAIVVLGVAFLITRRNSSAAHFDWSSRPGSSSNDGGGTINSAPGFPMIPAEAHGFDVAGNAYGLDDKTWGLGHHNKVSDAYDDFNPMDQDSSWLSDSMNLRGIDNIFGNDTTAYHDFKSHHIYVNPATGLPMISDSTAGFDVGGNSYGTSNEDMFGHHDAFGSGMGIDSHAFNDSFNSSGSDTDWT